MTAYKKYFVTLALVWAGCLVLFLLVYFLLLSPQAAAMSRVEQKFVQAKHTNEAVLLASKPETKTKLARELGQLQDQLGNFVTDFDNSSNLTFDIGRIASEKQLGSFTVKTVDSRRNANDNDNEYLLENKVQISFEGSFTQFAAFLNALERHHPVLFVDSFKIVRSLQENSPHKVDMDIAVFVRRRQES